MAKVQYNAPCKWLIMLALLIILFDPASAQQNQNSAFEFYGYLRSGYGIDGKGGPQEAFLAPNAEAKFRLGNEAETYVETGFSYAMRDDQDALFDTRVLLAYVTPTS